MRREPDKELMGERKIQGQRYAHTRRETLGLTQRQLADVLGVNIECVKRREIGRRSVRTINWLALCGINQLKGFKSLDHLISGEAINSISGEGIWSIAKRGKKNQAIRSLPDDLHTTILGMREQSGMERPQWADSLGVTRDTVQAMESGKHGITREYFFASVALFMQVKFQVVDLNRRTHRVTKFMKKTEET